MLQALKRFFDGKSAARSEESSREEPAPRRLAMAALLVHAAWCDREVDAREHAVLLRIFRTAFHLDAKAAEELFELAKQKESEATDLYRWTKVINDTFSYDEKLQLIEELWAVVIADGKIDAYESNLLLRVAGLLYVSDHDSATARQKVIQQANRAKVL